MLNQIFSFFRKVGVKVGLINGLEKIKELEGVGISRNMHNYIDKWKSLYGGKLKDIHELNYVTLSGKHTREIATLQMPKVLSNEMAKLIFNERCEIHVSDDNFSDFIQGVLEDNKFYSVFQDKLEYMFATGGIVIKPYVADGKVKLSYATAETFFPTQWDDTRIMGGVFVSSLKRGDKEYLHVERQEYKQDGYYYIENNLYEKSGSTYSKEVSFEQFFPEVAKVSRYQTEVPLFVYIKPNIANNIDNMSPLGVSIFANSLDTIKALDTAFDSLQREFRLGRKRMLVGASAVKAGGNFNGVGKPNLYVDTEEEFYEALPGDLDNEPFKEINSTLRIQEHISGINTNLALLSLQTGFDPSAFSFDKSGLKTATEVVSENSRTFKTKQSHENVIEGGLIELVKCIEVIGKIYGIKTGAPTASTGYDVSVFFDDSIAQDRMADIQEQAALVTNRFRSRLRAIMKLEGCTEEEAREIMRQIEEEERGDSLEIERYITEVEEVPQE